METLATLRRFALMASERYAASRRRRITLRAIESLAPHLRKDIGWMTGVDGESGPVRPRG